MWRRWGVLASVAASIIGIQTAQAAGTSIKPAETEEVTVTGDADGSVTSVPPEESRKQKTQVPGGFTIKTADEMKLGRASNFEDLLQRAPGVFLQSENGAEFSKISIRGSGITSEDEPLGVMFLLDGLSYNQADGEAILEDFDVVSLSHAEIFRGADALTIFISIGIPFTAITALREFPSTFMKRNFFAKCLLAFMRVPTCSVTSRVIR